ncbi:MAG: flagellar hook-basal body complex protein FliE [Alphaproteobacteria bacterium]|nr:flagellar hook-basal body complex protein FliE [Alphaproteobacteria bacterium]
MSNVSFSHAASAYQDALRVAQNIIEKSGAGTVADNQAAQGGSFIDMVGHALQSASDSGYRSEATATRALSGKADLTDVVTAVANAENALNTVVAIRDRVINAYQEIIKMPI